MDVKPFVTALLNFQISLRYHINETQKQPEASTQLLRQVAACACGSMGHKLWMQVEGYEIPSCIIVNRCIYSDPTHSDNIRAVKSDSLGIMNIQILSNSEFHKQTRPLLIERVNAVMLHAVYRMVMVNAASVIVILFLSVSFKT